MAAAMSLGRNCTPMGTVFAFSLNCEPNGFSCTPRICLEIAKPSEMAPF
jgi:hypothetical protein